MPPTQPFATIVMKNYPDEPAWHVDGTSSYRVNIAVGIKAFRDLLGRSPREIQAAAPDPSVPDTVMPHPAYGHLGWISVVNPGDRTAGIVLEQLAAAHASARRRHDRRRFR